MQSVYQTVLWVSGAAARRFTDQASDRKRNSLMDNQ